MLDMLVYTSGPEERKNNGPLSGLCRRADVQAAAQ